MRDFTVESGTGGAGLKDLQPFKAADNTSGVDWSRVRGMTFVGGKFDYTNRQNGTFNRVDLGQRCAGARLEHDGVGN